MLTAAHVELMPIGNLEEQMSALYKKGVHQIRNSLRYVASKNQEAFMVDLKLVYRAKSLGEAEVALDELESLWGEKYRDQVRAHKMGALIGLLQISA
jgi:transposase-like protein